MAHAQALKSPARCTIEASHIDELNEFLSELTRVSHKHGIAISGEPELFLMERDDYAHSYACDASSRLALR